MEYYCHDQFRVGKVARRVKTTIGDAEKEKSNADVLIWQDFNRPSELPYLFNNSVFVGPRSAIQCSLDRMSFLQDRCHLGLAYVANFLERYLESSQHDNVINGAYSSAGVHLKPAGVRIARVYAAQQGCTDTLNICINLIENKFFFRGARYLNSFQIRFLSLSGFFFHTHFVYF